MSVCLYVRPRGFARVRIFNNVFTYLFALFNYEILGHFEVGSLLFFARPGEGELLWGSRKTYSECEVLSIDLFPGSRPILAFRTLRFSFARHLGRKSGGCRF